MNNLTLDDKLFFFERNFFTLDGLWMIETEKEINWSVALKIDLVVWERLLNIIIRRIKKYLNISTNNLPDLIEILTFRWSVEGWEYEIMQNGIDKATVIINRCPYKSTMDRNPERHEKAPLICKEMCIPFYQYIVKSFNPLINVQRTKYMGLGDNVCDFNFSIEHRSKDKSEYREIRYPMRKVSKNDKLFYFERNFRTLDGLWVIETENETNWETALKLDIIVWQNLYQIIFRRVKKHLKVETNSLKDLIKILSFIWNCEGNYHDIIKVNENEAIINVKTCPYIGAMKRNKERRSRISSICKEMCIPYLQPVIKEFNPKIKLKRTKCIGLGDLLCDFHLTLE